MNLHAIDIAIIVGYFASVILIGLWVSRRGAKDLERFINPKSSGKREVHLSRIASVAVLLAGIGFGLICTALLGFAGAPALKSAEANRARYLSPSALVVAPDKTTVFIACSTAGEVIDVDLKSHRL